MNLQERITAFTHLGDALQHLNDSDWHRVIKQATTQNPWFTEPYILMALDALSQYLNHQNLSEWTRSYPMGNTHSKKVGIIMPGNIPLVGFHDLLCGLICGHSVNIKLSRQDQVLIPKVIDQLIGIDPRWQAYISYEDKLQNIDAIIATGSDNTARYFKYYFGHLPHIIRQNRSSIAILSGQESESDLEALAEDIFAYFGLGCRNVSKLFLPPQSDLEPLLAAFQPYAYFMDHVKYFNNYRYQRTRLLMDDLEHKDTGFALLQENDRLVAPIAMLYFEYYEGLEGLRNQIAIHAQKIQCIVSQDGWHPGSSSFGLAQHPSLSEYADQVDTMSFLLSFD